MSMERWWFLPEEDYAIQGRRIFPRFWKNMTSWHWSTSCKKEGRGFNFFHFMLDLKCLSLCGQRSAGCGSGTEYLAVTPWGDLYPCKLASSVEFLSRNVDTRRCGNTEARGRVQDVMYGPQRTKCKDCFVCFIVAAAYSAAKRWQFQYPITEA